MEPFFSHALAVSCHQRINLFNTMKIYLLAIGARMPSWVEQGYKEYAKRMPRECELQLVEVSSKKRGKQAVTDRILAEEGKDLLAAAPRGSLIVALDVLGKPLSTEQLSSRMEQWMEGGRDVALLVGGPEGLHADCIAKADFRWSLSPLTFPHPLVRVIVSEQLYRAWTLLNNHPYHRA